MSHKMFELICWILIIMEIKIVYGHERVIITVPMHIEKILHTKTIYKIIEKPVVMEATKQSEQISRPPPGEVTDKGPEPETKEPDDKDNHKTSQEPMDDGNETHPYEAHSGPGSKGQRNSGGDHRAAGYGYEQPSRHREHELKGTYGLNYSRSRGPVGANDDHVVKRKPGGDRYHGKANRGIPHKYGSYKHAAKGGIGAMQQLRPVVTNGLGHRAGGESHQKYRAPSYPGPGAVAHHAHFGDVWYVGDHVPEHFIDHVTGRFGHLVTGPPLGATGQNGGFGYGRPVGGLAYRGQNGYSLLYTHPASFAAPVTARPTVHDDRGIFGPPAARKPLHGLGPSNDGGANASDGGSSGSDGGGRENNGGGDVKSGGDVRGDGGYLVQENVAETKNNVTSKVPAPTRSNGSSPASGGANRNFSLPPTAVAGSGSGTAVGVTTTPKIATSLPQIVKNVYYTLDPVVPYNENKATVPVPNAPKRCK